MAYDAEDVEENFNKFVQSIDQYVKDPIKDFASIKPQLLDLFKTHRPIKVGDYQYGISKSLEENSQLIIHHLKNDHSLVREYFKSENDTWTCCECYSTSSTGESSEEDIAYALVLHGIVFAKIGHYCKPRRLSVVMNIQKFFKEKNIAKAVDLQRKYFGKEDLNCVSPKRKRGSGKRETKACSSKDVDEIHSEDRQQNHRDGKDDEPSTMDENCNESQEKLSPQEVFSKIIENLKEYTNEPKEVVMASKSKILSVLKHNRPLKIGYYHFGLKANLRKNHRLIVFEWGDIRRVREYSQREGRKYLWTCRECFRLNNRRGKNGLLCSLHMVSGIVFVLINHEIKCEPRDYKLVRIYQRCLEDGDTAKAWAIARKDGFSFLKNIEMSTFTRLDENFVTYLSKNSTSAYGDYNESNSEALTNLKRKMVSDSGNSSISRDKELPVQKRSKRNELALKDAVTISAEMEERLSMTTTSIYHFQKPSISMLQEICEKLNIEYHNNTAKLWDTIKFNQIDTVTPSANIKTHPFETDNFFQILSIFFTGKSEQHRKLKTTIIDSFREKAVSYGLMSMNDFNIRFMHALTDGHFIFIANFLKCRILIFDGKKKPKKYGNWESTSNACLTLVVAFKSGDYSIVLDL